MIPFKTPQGLRRGLTVPGSLVIEIDGLVLRGWQVGVDGQVLDHFVLEHEHLRDYRASTPRTDWQRRPRNDQRKPGIPPAYRGSFPGPHL